jgi:hypothetical protein
VYHRDIGTVESYEMACHEFPKRILQHASN